MTNLKLSSLSSTMSRVRSIVVEAGHRHPEYEASTVALRAYEGDPAVAEFLTAPLSKQLSSQRSHAATPSWSEEMEVALSQVKLLPSNMDSFTLTRFESLELKKQQEASLIVKNESVITIPNADRIERRCLLTPRIESGTGGSRPAGERKRLAGCSRHVLGRELTAARFWRTG